MRRSKTQNLRLDIRNRRRNLQKSPTPADADSPINLDITRVTQKLAPAHYLPIPVESTSSVRPRRRTSIPRRLIFWFSVERGIRKRSAASVWFQPDRSSMSTMMRRSTSSMIWKREGLGLSAAVRDPGSPGSGGKNSDNWKRTPRTISLLRMESGSRSTSTRS